MQALLQKIQTKAAFPEFPPQLEYWLHDVGLTEDERGNMTLWCPNSFAMRWLQDKYGVPLARALQGNNGTQVRLTFQVREATAPESSEQNRPIRPVPATAAPESALCLPAGPTELASPEEQPVASPPADASVAGTTSRFRLSTFIVGPSNRFAFSAAQEICKGVQYYYNPFFLLSGTGLGKTHLGHAIAHELRQTPGNQRVLTCTAEQFFSEMILHMKNKSIHVFKERYRQACDALILDDIQFVRGKRALQSELCFTLDALLSRKKQVVLLGNIDPQDSETFSESLRSRIFSGLSVSIEPPDHATRLAILSALQQASGAPIPQDALDTVARLVRSNVRDLEGAFHRLAAAQRFLRHAPPAETVHGLMRQYMGQQCGLLTLKEIRDHVARYFGLPPEDLSSRSRHSRVLQPRQIAMYLSRKHTDAPLHAIGTLYRRDHSSVLYAVRSLKSKMERTPRVQREVLFVEEKLLEAF